MLIISIREDAPAIAKKSSRVVEIRDVQIKSIRKELQKSIMRDHCKTKGKIIRSRWRNCSNI
jgi:hypothetical protein